MNSLEFAVARLVIDGKRDLIAIQILDGIVAAIFGVASVPRRCGRGAAPVLGTDWRLGESGKYTLAADFAANSGVLHANDLRYGVAASKYGGRQWAPP